MSYSPLFAFIHVSNKFVASILTEGYRPGRGDRSSAALNRRSIEQGSLLLMHLMMLLLPMEL